jgi:4-diphosphocytidyl-2-C-methyl-D-erythritol kinase
METYTAYAKINLSLEILGRRPDGYHNIASVMQTISLGDTLVVDAAPGGEITVETEVPELAEAPQDNLVWRAARILQQARKVQAGARITLTKRIPLAAGLGGGSSDAAMTLRALDALWGLSLSDAELLNAAAVLGSDVPFFLRGGTALVEGKGDQITPLRPLGPCGIVLITPDMVVPDKTKTLYTNLRTHEMTNGLITRHLVASLARGDVPTPSLLYNGFEDAAFRLFTELDLLQQTVIEAGGEYVRLSGSGPSMYVLYPTVEEAVALTERLTTAGVPAQVVTAVTPMNP